MAQTVIAVYDKHRQAIAGVHELREAGFQPEEISVFAPDPREIGDYADELGVRVVEAGAVGVVAGGVLGGLAGWLLGISGLLVPGAGLFLVAGPIAAALIGGFGGATVGGFVGILAGLGLPRHAAEEYERQLYAGRTLVIVQPESDIALAGAALARAHPVSVQHYDERIARAMVPTMPEVHRAPHSHAAERDPEKQVEVADPDYSLEPADVATGIEGQRVMEHTQWLDEADLHSISGKKDI